MQTVIQLIKHSTMVSHHNVTGRVWMHVNV